MNRQKTERRLAGETSPVRNLSRFSEESVQSNKGNDVASPNSPTVKTPEDKLGKSYFEKDMADSRASATLTGPVSEPVFTEDAGGEVTPVEPPARRPSRKLQQTPPIDTSFTSEDSPQPGRPLTLFLQYKSKVKKIVLDEGSNDLSVARIQLAFIDKFQWNSQNEGIDLPEIYIQDSVSGVRYELEDLSDIKNNTVLVLNVEPLDEVKRHVDDGFSNIRRVVEGIKTAVEDQQSAIKLISERQQETAKSMAGLSVAPQINGISPTVAPLGPAINTPKIGANVDVNQLIELQTLRRDLAIMRQTYSSFTSDIEASMAAVRTKAAAVKSVAIKVALPDIKGEAGRAYVNKELYETLPKESSSIIEFVDDVQDSIEDLRKDVVTRGVRPLPRQLEQMAKDLSHATAEVKRLEAYLNKEKPIWTKIWKQELQQVYNDKEALTDAEALVTDMKYDLDEVESTFKLVEEACRQQNLEAARDGADGQKAPRNVSGGKAAAAFALDQGVDPRKAKDGVLGEVKGLTIDHDSRLDAIQRAERARKKELESRSEGAFKKELAGFVADNKLKMTGGVDEVERMRKVKDERSRKENAERAAERQRAAAERKKAKLDGAKSEASSAPPAAEEKPNGNLEPPVDGSGAASPEVGSVDAKEELDPAIQAP